MPPKPAPSAVTQLTQAVNAILMRHLRRVRASVNGRPSKALIALEREIINGKVAHDVLNGSIQPRELDAFFRDRLNS